MNRAPEIRGRLGDPRGGTDSRYGKRRGRGRRVVMRWRRPAGDGGAEISDVVGVLEAADDSSFTVRKAAGDLVVIARERALAGKTVPAGARAASSEANAGNLQPAKQ